MTQTENCGRCDAVLGDDPEHCWFCQARLCFDCWEAYAHCGHPEADEANRRVKEVGSQQSYDELLEKGQMAPVGRVIAISGDIKYRQ